MAKKQSPSTLLWFIRRKSYVPLCEIRRRFELDGEEGAFIDGEDGARVFVGLPANTAGAVEKLWRQNKIGLELSVEFDCKVLIGVYPMAPVRDTEVVTYHNGHHAPAEPVIATAQVIDMPEPGAPVPAKIIDMPDPVIPYDQSQSASIAAAE